MDAVAWFRKRFRAEGDSESAVAQRAYMKSELAFHGVSSAQIRSAARAWCEENAIDHAALRRTIDELFATDYFDLHSGAVAILERHRKLVTPRDAAWLITLVRKAHCWAHVDWIATTIIPHALAPDPAPQLRAWARDHDFWVRRTALLAQLRELRSGGGDFGLFIELAEPMLHEREFFIRKAIGWVLREVSKKRPELVRDVVRRTGHQMSGLTKREATKYL